MQALVLLAFAATTAVPIYGLINGDTRYDDNVIDDIANAIAVGNRGEWQVVIRGELEEETTDHPDFWFYAFDANGRSVEWGEIPERLIEMTDAFQTMRSAYITGLGPNEDVSAILRRYNGDTGQIWIVTGNGPEVSIWSIFENPAFVSLLSLLTVVSFLVIPLVVRREMHGVDQIARDADKIDIAQRGMRLSMDLVPDELHSLVRAVNAALQRLDDGIERRHRFIADAAHELRTPIAILKTRLELAHGIENHGRVMLDVERLSNLANQLLDLERIEADALQFQEVNLVDLVAQVAADMAPVVIAAGDEIIFDAETEKVPVFCDPPSLSRAVTNLIQNSVSHGGVRLTVTVTVGANATVRVADTGPGVPENYRDIIFEPFSRVSPLDYGAGLGLSLVRDIVTRHNGRITVGDAPGGGALFEVSLPQLDR
ncbi:sensor histidine kinase [Devosia sp. Root685]|uniref:sensor histidine kinase n=1 Tax=Devosia sp. Root685 TaxID=1736587 RepID=UPI00138F2395|nr:HAMP domain-containing sensor histidine kinase [Devosia sp. Root685]